PAPADDPARRPHRDPRGLHAPDGTRGAGEHRHAVRLRDRRGQRGHPAPDPAGPAPRLPHPVGAVPADPVGLRLAVADAEPAHRDLAAVRHLDGDRHRRVLRLQPLPQPPRPGGDVHPGPHRQALGAGHALTRPPRPHRARAAAYAPLYALRRPPRGRRGPYACPRRTRVRGPAYPRAVRGPATSAPRAGTRARSPRSAVITRGGRPPARDTSSTMWSSPLPGADSTRTPGTDSTPRAAPSTTRTMSSGPGRPGRPSAAS